VLADVLQRDVQRGARDVPGARSSLFLALVGLDSGHPQQSRVNPKRRHARFSRLKNARAQDCCDLIVTVYLPQPSAGSVYGAGNRVPQRLE
jgi:hypothetical protein